MNIEKIKQQIKQGTYDLDTKFDLAIDILIKKEGHERENPRNVGNDSRHIIPLYRRNSRRHFNLQVVQNPMRTK